MGLSACSGCFIYRLKGWIGGGVVVGVGSGVVVGLSQGKEYEKKKRAQDRTLQSHLVHRDRWLLAEELSHQYDLFSSHCLESLWGMELIFPW